jgi:hypothetical protein
MNKWKAISGLQVAKGFDSVVAEPATSKDVLLLLQKEKALQEVFLVRVEGKYLFLFE